MWECQICKKINADKVKRCVLCTTLKPYEKAGISAEESFAAPIRKKTQFTYMFFLGLIIIIAGLNYNALLNTGKQFIQSISNPRYVPDATTLPINTPVPAQVKLTSLVPTKVPPRFFITNWKPISTEFPIRLEGKDCPDAIGLYIPSKLMKEESESVVLEYSLENRYREITFDLGCDSDWSSGKECGTYSLELYVDGTMLWGSGVKDKEYYQKGICVNMPDEAKVLHFEFTEQKGRDGTHNVVIGNPLLYLK